MIQVLDTKNWFRLLQVAKSGFTHSDVKVLFSVSAVTHARRNEQVLMKKVLQEEGPFMPSETEISESVTSLFLSSFFSPSEN